MFDAPDPISQTRRIDQMADTENPLMVPQEVADLPVKFDDDVFDDIAKSKDYLSRVQVMGGNSDYVKEQKIQIGRYALIHNKDSFDDLTPQFDCLVIGWRPKAMDVGGEQVISVYNHEAAEFKSIVEKSAEQNSGCMYGPEYLLWLAGSKTFATFFFSSKSARREAPNMKVLVGRAATCKIQLIKKKKYSWHSPTIVACSTPFDIPDAVAIKENLEKFNNPSESEVETVDESEKSDRER